MLNNSYLNLEKKYNLHMCYSTYILYILCNVYPACTYCATYTLYMYVLCNATYTLYMYVLCNVYPVRTV